MVVLFQPLAALMPFSYCFHKLNLTPLAVTHTDNSQRKLNCEQILRKCYFRNVLWAIELFTYYEHLKYIEQNIIIIQISAQTEWHMCIFSTNSTSLQKDAF